MTVYIFIFSTKNHILRTFLRQISFSGIPSKSERFLAINIISWQDSSVFQPPICTIFTIKVAVPDNKAFNKSILHLQKG